MNASCGWSPNSVRELVWQSSVSSTASDVEVTFVVVDPPPVDQLVDRQAVVSGHAASFAQSLVGTML